MIFTNKYDSPIGEMTIASENDMLIGVWLEGQKFYMNNIDTADTKIKKTDAVLVKTTKWLDNYFAGKKPNLADLPLCPEGSEFEHITWAAICNILYGDTVELKTLQSFMALASDNPDLDEKTVLDAIAHNPLAVLIPTHRILNQKEPLANFAQGKKAQQFLLKLEAKEKE